MRTSAIKAGIPGLIFILSLLSATAQDERMQYPPGLKNAYFGVNIGSINYSFSPRQLEQGYTVQSVYIPHAAVRITLYGCRINNYLSGRVTYMRPVKWVQYRNINGDLQNHSVWMNIAGLTFNGELPLSKKFSLSAEAGLAIITRNGFENDIPVVKNANYGTGLFGAAVQYHVGKKWDLQVSAVLSPANKKAEQP
ncbi:MAG TPA: hypothetical protein VMZ03_10200, partial [Chitinophagaceae bacterium]|nr:hypothetical protein [Chitinophagaceae bacterium]